MDSSSANRLDTSFKFPVLDDVGSLYSQTFKLYFGNFQWVLALSFFFVAPLLVVKNYVYTFAAPEQKLVEFWIDSSIMGLGFLCTAPSMAYILVRRLKDGAAPSFGSAVLWGLNCFPRNFGYHFVTGFMTILGLVLLVVPGVLVALWYALLSSVIAVEGPTQADPMGRSKTLVGPHLGTLFATGILVYLSNLVGAVIFGFAIGLMVGVYGLATGQQGLFSGHSHWIIHSLNEIMAVTLNINLGVLALSAYLSWSREEAHAVEETAPSPLPVPRTSVAHRRLPQTGSALISRSKAEPRAAAKKRPAPKKITAKKPKRGK